MCYFLCICQIGGYTGWVNYPSGSFAMHPEAFRASQRPPGGLPEAPGASWRPPGASWRPPRASWRPPRASRSLPEPPGGLRSLLQASRSPAEPPNSGGRKDNSIGRIIDPPGVCPSIRKVGFPIKLPASVLGSCKSILSRAHTAYRRIAYCGKSMAG